MDLEARGVRQTTISRLWATLIGAGLWLCLISEGRIPAQDPVRPVRIAVLPLAGDESGQVTDRLRASVRGDQNSSLELLDPDLIRMAARGAGYAGSLNLSRDEARALGLSLGCDFYLLGQTQLLRRLSADNRAYYEVYAGLFVVETRTGRLIKFIFGRAQQASEAEAFREQRSLVESGWGQSSSAIASAWRDREREIENVGSRPAPVLTDPDRVAEGDAAGQPFFYQRIKPEYPEPAELAGITATVELEAVFGEDGRVGEIEVIRWAGFGLDESAIAAVRRLPFKPAERDGKRLTIRGLVRYNFRRPLVQAAKPEAQSHEETERLRRSLEGIQMRGQRPRQNPNF
ncbi:MAG TPA: energy transducer TonB [Blastocatellia bacterium]|nr:energy transducer TonB [Blastocatellia bacterium]